MCKVAQENSKDWRIEVRVGSLNVRTMTGKDRELADMIEKERPGTWEGIIRWFTVVWKGREVELE